MNLKLNLFLAILLSFQIASAQSNRNLIGNEGPGGGDSYGIEMQLLGTVVYQSFDEKDIALLMSYGLTKEEFQSKVDTTIVSSKEHVFVKGRGEVDASNDDSGIVINRSRWRKEEPSERVVDTIHEYFGRAKLEKNVATISIQFRDLINRVSHKVGTIIPLYIYDIEIGYLPVNNLSGCAEGSNLLEKLKDRVTERVLTQCRDRNLICSPMRIEYETESDWQNNSPSFKCVVTVETKSPGNL